jgi:hypothetical protein
VYDYSDADAATPRGRAASPAGRQASSELAYLEEAIAREALAAPADEDYGDDADRMVEDIQLLEQLAVRGSR